MKSQKHQTRILNKLVVLLRGTTLEYQRNATAQTQGSPATDNLNENLYFADSLGTMPSLTEHQLQEIETLLAPIERELCVISDETRMTPGEVEENPKKPQPRLCQPPTDFFY